MHAFEIFIDYFVFKLDCMDINELLGLEEDEE